MQLETLLQRPELTGFGDINKGGKMSANRSQYFYEEDALTGALTGNSFKLKFTSRHVRLAVAGGDMTYSLIGPRGSQVDGTIKDGENLPFDGLETARISLAGTGTYRVWAYK